MSDGEYKTIDGVLHFVEWKDGKQVATPVGDPVGYEAARDENSHAKFFGTPEARQKIRRAQALNHMVQNAFVTFHPMNVEKQTISDEKYLELMRHPEQWDEEGFTPVSRYKERVAKIRTVPNHEVGIVEKDGRVIWLYLEEGYSKVFAVSIDMTKPVPDESVEPTVNHDDKEILT